MEYRVAVKETAVGLGVFAKSEYLPEGKISAVGGQVFAEDKHYSEYCMDLGNGTVLEPDPPFRFLNHSCEPNAELIIWEDEPNPPEMCLHAIRQITPGEELTIDYAWRQMLPFHAVAGAGYAGVGLWQNKSSRNFPAKRRAGCNIPWPPEQLQMAAAARGEMATPIDSVAGTNIAGGCQCLPQRRCRGTSSQQNRCSGRHSCR